MRRNRLETFNHQRGKWNTGFQPGVNFLFEVEVVYCRNESFQELFSFFFPSFLKMWLQQPKRLESNLSIHILYFHIHQSFIVLSVHECSTRGYHPADRAVANTRLMEVLYIFIELMKAFKLWCKNFTVIKMLFTLAPEKFIFWRSKIYIYKITVKPYKVGSL